MRNKLTILAAVATVCASCTLESFEERTAETESVEVKMFFHTVKVGMDSGHSSFKWSSGDIITVFNNKDNSTLQLSVDEPVASVDVPKGASTLYAFCPGNAGFTSGPGSVSLAVPPSQMQTEAGRLDGLDYPVAARADIIGSSASLVFTPVASALAMNIYKTVDFIDGEKIVNVKVTPLNATGFVGTSSLDLTTSLAYTGGDSDADAVTVTLGTPSAVGNARPADSAAARAYSGQIYLLLGRKSYTGMQFDIVTTEKTYRLTSSSFTFNCLNYDFLTINIDLAKGTVIVDETASIESVTSYSNDESGGGSINNPLILDIGTLDRDVIPDFSRVGYKWGDQPIPTLPVKKTITEADVWSNTEAGGGAYADSTAYIQAMVDEVGQNGGGAVLFKNGRYNVSRTIFIDHNNVVVRGESREGTVFYGDGHKGWSLFFIGASLPASSATAETDVVWNGRALQLKSLKAAGDGAEFGNYYIYSYSPKVNSPSNGAGVDIIENFVPVGRMYAKVSDPSQFSVGDYVSIVRPHDSGWLSDIGMDKIASNGPKRSIAKKAPVQQWTDRNFSRKFRRRVTAVSGSRIYFDAPLTQSLDGHYGGGTICREKSYAMVSGSGVENLTIDSWYDKTKTMTLTVHGTGAKYTSYKDENHTWKAVEIKAAEHCWVKDVDSWHMGYSCVCITTGAQNITVQGCNSYEPASYLSGGRRYAFVLEGMATKCLFRDCTVDMERHGFISNVDCGPNVYLNCTGTRMCDGPEPHQGWCLGALYDNMTVNDTHLYVRDRGNSGTGHGWAAGNYVFWNCHAYSLECSMVWSKENSPEIETHPNGYKFHSDHPSAYNWCIGCVGLKKSGTYSYKSPYFKTDPLQEDYYIDVLGYQYRPEGYWYPQRADGTTGSDADRINLNAIPADLASQPWWPGFSGKVASFSNPESLYLSQLEDRHAKGVFINL